MNALLKKEVRLLLPSWIPATVLALIAGCLMAIGPAHGLELSGWAGLLLGAAGLFLGLTTFGQELGGETLSQLLAMPAARQRLLAAKFSVLGIAVLSLWLITVLIARTGSSESVILNQSGGIGGFAVVPLLVTVSGGLWATLLFRQVSTAFWVAVLLPLLLRLGLEWAQGAWFVSAITPVTLNPSAFLSTVFLLGYSGAGLIAAAALFLHWQEAPQRGLVNWISRRPEALSKDSGTFVSPMGPIAAQVRKEFQFQRESLLMATGFAIVQVAVIVLQRVGNISAKSDASLFETLLAHFWVLWQLLPMVIGGRAIAEERHHHTLVGQLCLPIARWKFLAVKLSVSLLLGVALGAVIPRTIELLKPVLGVADSVMARSISLQALEASMLISALLTLAGIYASTLSRGLLAAFAIILPAALLLAGTVLAAHLPPPFYSETLGRWIIWSAIGVFLLRQIFRYAVRPAVGAPDGLKSLVKWSLLLPVSMTAASLTYNRCWEVLTYREPAHGPAQMVEKGEAMIVARWDRALVLLPSGQIWTAAKQQWDSPAFLSGSEGMVPGKDWTALATTANGPVVALKSDGSLWFLAATNGYGSKLAPTEMPGSSGEKWIDIGDGPNYLLAIRADHTLWCWPMKGTPAKSEFSGNPVQVNRSQTWRRIVDDRQRFNWQSLVEDSEGNIWRWNNDPKSADQYPNPGGNWLQKTRDGPQLSGYIYSLGGSSMFASFLVKTPPNAPPEVQFNYQTNFSRSGWITFSNSVHRLDSSTDWRSFSVLPMGTRGALIGFKESLGLPWGNSVVGLKNDRSLWMWDMAATWSNLHNGKQPKPVRLSRNSDWVSQTYRDSLGGIVALAADGGLWLLDPAMNRMPSSTVLAPSRKPIRLAGIFDPPRN